MTDFNTLFGDYLKKEDFPQPAVMTVSDLKMEKLQDETKVVVYFLETDKGLVLNKTNAELIARALNTSQIEEWNGKQITLYNDPSVSFGGKLTGGIRVQANPKPAQNAPQAPSAALKAALGSAGPVPGVDDAYNEINPPPFDDDVPA